MRIHSGLVMRWTTLLIQLQVAHDITATGGFVPGNETAGDTLDQVNRTSYPAYFLTVAHSTSAG